MSLLGEIRRAADPAVRRYLRRVDEALAATLAGEHGAAVASATATLTAGGKRLRPLLVYLSAPQTRRNDTNLVQAGAAVELVHSATLVHDDVLDQAPLRRGRPTIWQQSGARTATATGDLLFARAFALLTQTGDMRGVAELADCTLGLARGEALQMLQARRPDTTPDQYLERCELKTGLLFATACSLGGRLGGLESDACRLLRSYGTNLGLAFQIADDVLDCAGSPDTTGKPLGTDLLDGTATYPLLVAASRDAAVADALVTRPPPDAVLGLLARVADTGAIRDAQMLAGEYARRAQTALDDLEEQLDTRPLRDAAIRVVDRDR